MPESNLVAASRDTLLKELAQFVSDELPVLEVATAANEPKFKKRRIIDIRVEDRLFRQFRVY
jgi:hypothetical protein